MPALSFGKNSLQENQGVVSAFSSSQSSVVSLLECGSLSSIASTPTSSPRCKLKFHTLDETASNQDEDMEDMPEDGELLKTSKQKPKSAVRQANRKAEDRLGLSLAERLDKLTVGQELTFRKNMRSWCKSPTKMFIKNFP